MGDDPKIPEESCSYISDEDMNSYKKWQELLKLEKEARALKAKFSRLSMSEELNVQDHGKILRWQREVDDLLRRIGRKKMEIIRRGRYCEVCSDHDLDFSETKTIDVIDFDPKDIVEEEDEVLADEDDLII